LQLFITGDFGVALLRSAKDSNRVHTNQLRGSDCVTVTEFFKGIYTIAQANDPGYDEFRVSGKPS
jgi:hypothetical protein